MTITIPYNWKPRPYQLGLWNAMEHGCKRAVAVWHRRAGKDLTAFNITVKQALVNRVGLYWHVLPTYEMGRKIVWNGMTGDGTRFLDFWPPGMDRKRRDDHMLMELENGSMWQVVGSDDPDRLVGSNPVGVVFSEYSLQNPDAWNYIRPILTENGGWAIFIYTARGRNHGYDIIQHALKSKHWYGEVLTVEDTLKPVPDEENGGYLMNNEGDFLMVPVVTREAIKDDEESGMAPEIIQQEYWCSFDAPLIGSYYGDQMTEAMNQGRIGDFPWEPRLPVDTWWDLGIGDHNAIWFVQYLGKEIRIIDYEQGSGKSMEDWIKLCREKAYIYGEHYGPHDLDFREYSSGKTRWARALELNFRFNIVPKGSVEDGINEVRSILRECYFNESKTSEGIECLRQYRKEFDTKLQVYRDKPLHDHNSHGADAFRTGVMGRNLAPIVKPTQQFAMNDYDEFGDNSFLQETAISGDY